MAHDERLPPLESDQSAPEASGYANFLSRPPTFEKWLVRCAEAVSRFVSRRVGAWGTWCAVPPW